MLINVHSKVFFYDQIILCHTHYDTILHIEVPVLSCFLSFFSYLPVFTNKMVSHEEVCADNIMLVLCSVVLLHF